MSADIRDCGDGIHRSFINYDSRRKWHRRIADNGWPCRLITRLTGRFPAVHASKTHRSLNPSSAATGVWMCVCALSLGHFTICIIIDCLSQLFSWLNRKYKVLKLLLFVGVIHQSGSIYRVSDQQPKQHLCKVETSIHIGAIVKICLYFEIPTAPFHLTCLDSSCSVMCNKESSKCLRFKRWSR